MDKLRNAISPDLYMLPAKASYFCTSGQDGAFKPYMMPFFVGVGLNKAEAGFVTGNLMKHHLIFCYAYIVELASEYSFFLKLGILS